MKLATWKCRSFYSAGSLKAAARELAMYKLGEVSVQEVRWDNMGKIKAGFYDFFYRKEMKIINWEQVFLYSVE